PDVSALKGASESSAASGTCGGVSFKLKRLASRTRWIRGSLKSETFRTADRATEPRRGIKGTRTAALKGQSSTGCARSSAIRSIGPGARWDFGPVFLCGGSHDSRDDEHARDALPSAGC